MITNYNLFTVKKWNCNSIYIVNSFCIHVKHTATFVTGYRGIKMLNVTGLINDKYVKH